MHQGLGTGVILTTNINEEGQKQYLFNNLGDYAEMAKYLINDMVEGYHYKLKQQAEVNNLYMQ